MKALSIRQPWAWAIVHAGKDIENRDWRGRPTHRGPLLIHASLTFDRDGYQEVVDLARGIPVPEPDQFELGGIVGVAELVGVVRESSSRWFYGPLGLVLANARPLPLTPLKGSLGLFDVDVGALGIKELL